MTILNFPLILNSTVSCSESPMSSKNWKLHLKKSVVLAMHNYFFIMKVITHTKYMLHMHYNKPLSEQIYMIWQIFCVYYGLNKVALI